MLKLSDSRNFARTLAAIGLVVGPLLFCAGNLVDPAWDDDTAAYLADVAANEGRYAAAGALWTIGSLFFIAGTLGLGRLLRGRRVTLGQIAASLLTIGLIGLAAGAAFNAFELAMANFDDRAAAVGLAEELEDSGLLIGYWMSFFFLGIVLGSILLAVSLFRRRVVPIWSPLLVVLAVVLGFAGGETAVLSAASFAVLAAGLLPLAMRIWSLSDEEWSQWAPLGEDEADAEAADRAVSPDSGRDPVGVAG